MTSPRDSELETARAVIQMQLGTLSEMLSEFEDLRADGADPHVAAVALAAEIVAASSRDFDRKALAMLLGAAVMRLAIAKIELEALQKGVSHG